MTHFDQLGISEQLAALLKKQGITTPTPVQEQSIPPMRAGRDVIAQAQTYSVRYQSAQGRTITAIYINSHSPMMVELREGNTVEKLVQVRLRSQGVEYANPSSRWQIGDGFAILIRGGKEVVFKEIVE